MDASKSHLDFVCDVTECQIVNTWFYMYFESFSIYEQCTNFTLNSEHIKINSSSITTKKFIKMLPTHISYLQSIPHSSKKCKSQNSRILSWTFVHIFFYAIGEIFIAVTKFRLWKCFRSFFILPISRLWTPQSWFRSGQSASLRISMDQTVLLVNYYWGKNE